MSVLLRNSIVRQSAAASRRPGRWLSTPTATATTKHGGNLDVGFPSILSLPKFKAFQELAILRTDQRGERKEGEETPEARWSEDLASDAEAFVKSSREEIDATEDLVAKLDEKTKKLFTPKGIKN